MLKEKRKLKPNRQKHRLMSLALILFLLLTIFYPLRLLSDLYHYNGLFLGIIGLGIVAYGVWGFLVQRIRLVAVLLLLATLAWGIRQQTGMVNLSPTTCKSDNIFIVYCSVYNGWCGQEYLVLADMPLGVELPRNCVFVGTLF